MMMMTIIARIQLTVTVVVVHFGLGHFGGDFHLDCYAADVITCVGELFAVHVRCGCCCCRTCCIVVAVAVVVAAVVVVVGFGSGFGGGCYLERG